MFQRGRRVRHIAICIAIFFGAVLLLGMAMAAVNDDSSTADGSTIPHPVHASIIAAQHNCHHYHNLAGTKYMGTCTVGGIEYKIITFTSPDRKASWLNDVSDYDYKIVWQTNTAVVYR
jgi:hypothetical protein